MIFHTAGWLKPVSSPSGATASSKLRPRGAKRRKKHTAYADRRFHLKRIDCCSCVAAPAIFEVLALCLAAAPICVLAGTAPEVAAAALFGKSAASAQLPEMTALVGFPCPAGEVLPF